MVKESYLKANFNINVHACLCKFTWEKYKRVIKKRFLRFTAESNSVEKVERKYKFFYFKYSILEEWY